MKLWDFDLKRGKRILKSDTSENSIEALILLQDDCSSLALGRNNVEGSKWRGYVIDKVWKYGMQLQIK